jgi:hypothetical protein
MTPQEAIETIKIAQAEVEWEYPIDYAAAFDEAVKALEMQIPKKILKHGNEYLCPVCGADINCDAYIFYHAKFCEECGQKLDWGDDE